MNLLLYLRSKRMNTNLFTDINFRLNFSLLSIRIVATVVDQIDREISTVSETGN